ncbi:MAG: RNA-binding protein [Arcobacter butzleri]|jgi:RNA recognition motif-containing protein|nr:RNA-binding protein [Arcobacteraceae bacterium]MDY0365706.1 RNA-binding protein [Arcobacteraceae bacterium]NLO17986.1 RNA-binding protein [Aliarcobacter butzleri]
MNIYVGNLSYGLNETDFRDLFEQFGGVKSAKVIKDRETGRSKGFGFVEMDSRDNGLKAIEVLNGKDFQGRNLVVNEAREREPRTNSGSSFGRDNNRRR